MELEQAIKHAIDGNALLFLGSGFSADAISISGQPIPTGRSLAKKLSSAVDVEEETEDLMIASDYYIKAFGESKTVELLEQTFKVKTLLPKHSSVALFPWKAIFTTNYDDVVELAFRMAGKSISAVTLDMDGNDFTSKHFTCVHINGYIGSLTNKALKNSFKLTNYSYLTEEFSKSNWSFIFRRELESVKTIIFIGYSLYDIDIARILNEDESLRQKIIFIESQGKDPEKIKKSVQANFGNVLPIGAENFWERCKEIEKIYQKQEYTHELISLNHFSPQLLDTRISDTNFWSLLLYGSYHYNLIYTSIVANEPYFIQRKQSLKIADLIQLDNRAVFVLGDLGNGKTMTMIGAACILFRQGYDIYFLEDDVSFHPDDISHLSSSDKKTIVFVENYIRHLDALKTLLLKSNDDIKVVCSARTSLHEVNTHHLPSLLPNQDYSEVLIDKIESENIEQISNLLSSHKIWGDRDSWSEDRKVKYIRSECKEEFSSLLLDIVKSPDIQERFSSIFSIFKEKSDVGKVFLTAATLAVLGYDNPKANIISELTNSNFVFSSQFKHNEAVLQIATISGGQVVPRSSVIAKYSMTHFSEASFVIDNLINITTRANELGSTNNSQGQIYFRIYRDLVTFSVLQPMIPEKKRRESLIRFYEALKNLSSAKNHPHFWLQYAIARLSMDTIEDAIMAKSYLDAAYAHAKKRDNYHTRHLDNVSARYHLTMARYQNNYIEMMENIISARDLLSKELHSEKTDAPYKVSRLFSKVFNDKKSVLKENDATFIKQFLRSVVDAAEKLPENIKNRASVTESLREIKESLG